MTLDTAAIRKTWAFLGTIAAIEALVVVAQSRAAVTAVTRHAESVPLIGWVLALAVALATIVYTARALDLWPLLALPTPFKILGLLIAVPSAILEEAIFRFSVMNVLALHEYGPLPQVVASAFTFGADTPCGPSRAAFVHSLPPSFRWRFSGAPSRSSISRQDVRYCRAWQRTFSSISF